MGSVAFFELLGNIGVELFWKNVDDRDGLLLFHFACIIIKIVLHNGLNGQQDLIFKKQ
jgi:hypothetical protein